MTEIERCPYCSSVKEVLVSSLESTRECMTIQYECINCSSRWSKRVEFEDMKEEKKINWDKPLRIVGEQHPVRLLCRDLKIAGGENSFRYGIAVTTENGSEYLSYGRNDGSTISGVKIENVPEKRTGWLNIYETCYGFHKSKRDADAESLRGRIARIKIEYEEGQFDE